MVKNFKLVVSVTKLPGNDPVYHKQDGQRFSSSNTIKMNVDTKYRLLFTTRPSTRIRRLHVQGEKAEFTEVKPEGKNQDEDEECFQVESKWVTTSCAQTKRAKRTDVPIVLEFDDCVNMKLVLQVKFYSEEETEHAQWGQQLHGIEYECCVPDGGTYVDVKKVKFF